MPIQNNIILAGGLFGSIYLFSVSLNNLNKIFSYDPLISLTRDYKVLSLRNYLIFINGTTLFFSCYAFNFFIDSVKK